MSQLGREGEEIAPSAGAKLSHESGVVVSEPERPRRGGFSTGNELWRRRLVNGVAPKYETAEQLIDACEEYFIWTRDNPIYEERPFAYEGEVSFENIAKARVMTIVALCTFIGITVITWRNWRNDRPDLKGVQAWAEGVIYCNKFEGASAGLYNANIISRDLGLADKSELSGPNGGPIQTEVTSARELLAGKLARINPGSPEEDDPSGTD